MTVQKENGKRVYQLTQKGRSEVDEEATHIARIWRRAEEWGEWGDALDPEAAELVRPAFRVMKAAYRAAARSDFDEDQIERVREVLERTVDELTELGRDAKRRRRGAE